MDSKLLIEIKQNVELGKIYYDLYKLGIITPHEYLAFVNEIRKCIDLIPLHCPLVSPLTEYKWISNERKTTTKTPLGLM